MERLENLRRAKLVLDEERARRDILEKERATIRIAAETGARQRGLGIAETDKVGRAAAASVPDEGPRDPTGYLAAQRLEDEHAIEGIMVIVRDLSELRWEHSAPVRVGCRMGRPEKAAPRVMNPMAHSLFPIELNGGINVCLTTRSTNAPFVFNWDDAHARFAEKNRLCYDAIIAWSMPMERAKQERHAEVLPHPIQRNQTLTVAVKSNRFAWTKWLKTRVFALESTDCRGRSNA